MKRFPLRVLLSARDPGATDNVFQLFRLLVKDRDFDPVLAASGTASSQLKARGVCHIPFSLSRGEDHILEGNDPSRLIAKAERLIDQTHPDLIIVSLSSFGAGIDEALIAAAHIPVFAFQDFWGDVNRTLEKYADLYFVLDQAAGVITRQRHGVKVCPTGMPKYLKYREENIPGVRMAARSRLGLTNEDSLVGWFGQSPEIPGHEMVFHSFISAVSLLGSSVKVLIREHPKFAKAKPSDPALKYGVKLETLSVPDNSLSTDSLLAACDLVVTPFSLCGLDHAMMSSLSTEPIGSVVYLMNNPDIRQFAKENSGLVEFPIVTENQVGICIQSDDVPLIAKTFLSQIMTGSEKYFENSKKNIVKFDYSRFKQEILQGL